MNLEQQKKQARELLHAIRAGNEDAISRLRRHHSRWTKVDEATVRQLAALHDAQFVLAREQGFASWPKLKAYAEPASRSRHTRLFVADVLGRHAVAPNNLRAAAGLGIPELVAACFTDERTLTPDASAARGFYRPHSGFPDWQPSADPQEVLDEALVWACKSNRVSVLERLVRAGARLDADPYRGTPLIWAAACNRTEAAAWLLDRGASVNRKGTFGGLTHGRGVTALHMASQSGHLPMVKLLIERGADRSVTDDLYHATAESAAGYFGQVEVRDFLRLLGA